MKGHASRLRRNFQDKKHTRLADIDKINHPVPPSFVHAVLTVFSELVFCGEQQRPIRIRLVETLEATKNYHSFIRAFPMEKRYLRTS